MAVATNYKLVGSIITSKVFQNVTYVCLQKLATDTAQLSNKGKASPPNAQEQQKDVAGLSSAVFTTPSQDPNPEPINRIASPDPNSSSSVAEVGKASPHPNSPSSLEEYENENSKTTSKETVTSFPTVADSTRHTQNPLLNVPQQTKDITQTVNVQKFVTGHLPQNIVDSFNSKSSKTEVNLNEATKLQGAQDNKLLLMSVELGMIPECIQLLCSELTPCKAVANVYKENDADTVKNLITNIEQQCKLLNGICESDYNKLFLMALELGSLPEGLQTFFNEHFFVNNSKFKNTGLKAEEFARLTKNLDTKEKFGVGVTSILSLLYGKTPRIFDEYLNMSNSVSENVQHLTKSLDVKYLHNNEPPKRDNFEETPPFSQRIHEGDTSHLEQKADDKGNYSKSLTHLDSNTVESTVNEKHSSNTSTNIYSNTADTKESVGNEKNVNALVSSKLPRDITEPSGVFGKRTHKSVKQMRDPNLENSPKMTNPAPKSPYSILTEENAISVGKPSPSIQPEETCKHSLLPAQHAPGVVKEVPTIFSKPLIDDTCTPSLTDYFTDLAKCKLKNETQSVTKRFDGLTHQEMMLCLLTAELGILTKSTVLCCSKSSPFPPIKSPKLKTLLEHQQSSKNFCNHNLSLVMLESGILPVGIKTVRRMYNYEKCCKSVEVTNDLGVNCIHGPEIVKIKHALIPWKSAPNALMKCAKKIHVVPIEQSLTVDISKYIKSSTENFLQTEKCKKYLHVFEIPLHNEESFKRRPEDHDTGILTCNSKTSGVSNEVCGMNTMVVPGVNAQEDCVSISTSKTSNLCNKTQTSKICATMPAGKMDQNVSNHKSHSKYTVNLPIPFVAAKLEVLNYTIPHKGPHHCYVKVEGEQIEEHKPQETGVTKATVTLSNMTKTDAEISNTSEYLHLASNVIKHPEIKVQQQVKSKLSMRSYDLLSPRQLNCGKPNTSMEEELQIVSPDQTVLLPALDTSNLLSISCGLGKEKAKNNNIVVDSPKKTATLSVSDTSDTRSISCAVGKEKTNKSTVDSPKKTTILPVVDMNDMLSVSCNAGKEKANDKNLVVSPKKTKMLPVLYTNDPLSSTYVGKENVNKKAVLPTVMSPIIDTNDTLTFFLIVGKEKYNYKNALSPGVKAPVLDTNDSLSISCNEGIERVNNNVVFHTALTPVLDTKHSLLISCSVGKEKVDDNAVLPPVLNTEKTHSIPCNVEKNKVKNIISEENASTVPYKNIVSVFYEKLCVTSNNSDSNKHSHTNKQDTVSSSMSNNDIESLNFTKKAQRSIEAVVKVLTDKYNSVSKLSAHYTSKSDDIPPNEVKMSDFHMADIFKQHIWKPITLNISKIFDYWNNINLHNTSTLKNVDVKSDFPQKLESCDLEIYNKLNSQFLLTQLNKDNIFTSSKYKYFAELCPEPFATDPKPEIEPIHKLHLEKCIAEVAGPSSAVLVVCDGEVGPGASKSGDYKNPEYFSYHKESYFEAEVEMLKYRLPQPSSERK